MRAPLKAKGRKATAVFVAVAAVAVVTTVTFAEEGDGRDDSGSEAGVPITVAESDSTPSGGGEGFEPIVTGSSAYDPTILTKFVPASAFAGDFGDEIAYSTGFICMNATNSIGNHVLRAPLELPDGAKIMRFSAFGRDDSAAYDMGFALDRTTVSFPLLGPSSITNTDLGNFNSSAASGVFGLTNSSDLNEVTGNTASTLGLSSTHNFYELYVQMNGDVGTDHEFCGIQVTYQVPAVSSAAAQTFYPISPVRAFDSRQAGYAPNNVLLTPNTSRVISIKDGHDSNGAVNLVDAVPAGATAVTYNLTVTGTTGFNYVAVTPGAAGSFTASAINFGPGVSLANGGTVALASDRIIKIWGGDQTGSTHVIIDITGYYAPLPNMGN